MPSVSPISTLAVSTPAVHSATVAAVTTPVSSTLPANFVGAYRIYNPVANLEGLNFTLLSITDPSKPNHQLVIQTENWHYPTGNASFTGEWIGDKNPNGGTANPITGGSLSNGPNGTINISFSWNGDHTLTGTITWVPQTFVAGEYIAGHYIPGHYLEAHWHLDGQTNAGPGHVEGDAYVPLLFVQ